MVWITDLLKHLSVARSGVIAAFATALILLIPGLVGLTISMPNEWHWIVTAIALFTGSLVAIWLFELFYKTIRIFCSGLRYKLDRLTLSNKEESLIITLGFHPTASLNIERGIDHSQIGISKLELFEVARKLDKKGLVYQNSYNPEVVSLTEAGRQVALILHKKKGIQ